MQSRRPARATFPRPALALACLSIASAAVYLLVFVRAWYLPQLYPRKLLDLRQMSIGDPAARWRLLVAFLVLALIYWLGWRAARQARGRLAWGIVLGGAALSGLVLLFLYPFDAADVFDNIMHGRILAVHGANPFAQVATDFRGDPFYRHVGWRTYPSAYGPGWELVAGGVARLAGDGILANVLAFKLTGGLFLAGCVAIVAAILRRTAPERALAGVLLLAWNPIVLYETLGQGHNDAAMLFWILVSALCVERGRHTLSVLALVAGALFKFVPLLLLPAAGLIALRRLPGARARLGFLAGAATASALLVAIAYAPFWYGPDVLGIGRRAALLTASLPAAVWALLQATTGQEAARTWVSAVAAVVTAGFALWQGVRAWRKPTWQGFVEASFAVLMFYLLVTCLWFQQWYVVWPLGLVPLLSQGRVAWLGILFGFSALAKPLIFEPLWLWPYDPPDRRWLELRLGPAVMAVPWLLSLTVLWMAWRSRVRHRLEDRLKRKARPPGPG